MHRLKKHTKIWTEIPNNIKKKKKMYRHCKHKGKNTDSSALLTLSKLNTIDNYNMIETH
uniref:Uncharacterized protein n=1 Tax=Rhizophora mucronata TaxID=61149 RepID=A0A2P2N8D2_RHIMU